MASFTVHPTVVPGDTWTASNQMTYVKYNLDALFPYTAAGQLAYSSAVNTLAALNKPSVNSFLKNTSGGVFSWVPATEMPGAVHTMGSNYTNSLDGSTNTSYEAIGAGVKFNLTLTVPCTIVAWAVGSGYKDLGTYNGYWAIAINGTTDPNGDNATMRSTLNLPFSAVYKAAAVPAGTRTVELMHKTANAGDVVYTKTAFLFAIAFVDP